MSANFAKQFPLFAVLAFTSLASNWALGQTNTTFNVAGPATWNSGANWNPMFVPDAQFNEIAVIGSNRSAFVDDSPTTPGGITIDSGTLEIRSTGSLTAVPGSLTTGDLAVGGVGAGALTVRRGGSLNVRNVTMGANTANQITLGETGGSGTATFSVTGGTLTKTTQFIGPNGNFSSSGGLDFSGGTLVPVITGPTHSTINVTGTANLGGTVKPQFSGYTPVLGNSWNLVTAAQLTGGFTLDTSSAPVVPRGTGFYVKQTNTTSTLKYSNLLVLTVDRGNGATSIQNVVGSPIAFDGYTIFSPTGILGGSWNSLQDQAIAGWDEADNSSASRLTEFKTSGTTSVNVGGSLSLGSPFSPPVPSALGIQPGENLSFQYSVPGEGTLPGIVEFTGRFNNLVLTINPATGQAAIQNESPLFNASLDAYSITSASGKLLTGNAAWNSLQDQNLSGWDEADNSSVTRLTEFKTAGGTLLNGGGTVLNLGAPINIAGGAPVASDFTFTYSLSTGQMLQGVVKLGTLPSPVGVPGDYNGNGVVDAADYVLWRKGGPLQNEVATIGSVTPEDYTAWRARFGNTSGSGSSAMVNSEVPEPTTLTSAVLVLVCLGVVRRNFQRVPFRLRGN